MGYLLKVILIKLFLFLSSGKLKRVSMKVLFFAQSREIAGCDTQQITPHKVLTQDEFWLALDTLYPGIAALKKTARLARNETYLHADELLSPDDEIAVIPPVSGG